MRRLCLSKYSGNGNLEAARVCDITRVQIHFEIGGFKIVEREGEG